jgi:hypothetical protein
MGSDDDSSTSDGAELSIVDGGDWLFVLIDLDDVDARPSSSWIGLQLDRTHF